MSLRFGESKNIERKINLIGGIIWDVQGTKLNQHCIAVSCFPDLRGLVESGALLPRSHAAWQAEDDAPVSDDLLRHEGHLDEHGGAGRQVADADREHVLRGERRRQVNGDENLR